MAPRCALIAWAAAAAAAAPQQMPNFPAMQEEIERRLRNPRESSRCYAPECEKPAKQYESLLGAQPGIQWNDHGGYCGAWSIQRIAMTKGVWISQQQVRNHASPGGGNDVEILATNIDEALANLKLKSEGSDYKGTPTPQADAYRGWMKRKLAAGHGVVWMIMLTGGHFPVYPGLQPYGR